MATLVQRGKRCPCDQSLAGEYLKSPEAIIPNSSSFKESHGEAARATVSSIDLIYTQMEGIEALASTSVPLATVVYELIPISF